MSTIRYKANSLEDIAIHFDGLARQQEIVSGYAHLPKRDQNRAKDRANTWRQAAQFLRDTDISTPQEKK